MSLPKPPEKYDPDEQAQNRRAIDAMDAKNHKRGRDIEVGLGARVILIDTTTGDRVALTIDSGAVVLTTL